jgi:hypothetical protein
MCYPGIQSIEECIIDGWARDPFLLGVDFLYRCGLGRHGDVATDTVSSRVTIQIVKASG